MTAHQNTDNGPDLSLGIPVSDIPAGGLLEGHIAVRCCSHGLSILRPRRELCTHHASLADGFFDGEVIRCPSDSSASLRYCASITKVSACNARSSNARA
jgi:hypothetical protein